MIITDMALTALQILAIITAPVIFRAIARDLAEIYRLGLAREKDR